MSGLAAFDKRLCNELQTGLPIADRPFMILACILISSEDEVIKRTRKLIKLGLIRRLGVSINWRAIGYASALVTAHIEQEDLQKVVRAVNKLPGVSHNYLREHYYNLWFTLRADSQKKLNAILKKLSKRFGVKFHSLPVVRVFKLDARFDATSGGKRLLPEIRRQRTEDRGPRTISGIDKRLLTGLQKGLKVVKRPFDFISDDKFEIYDGLIHISEMIHSGVINRLGAMVNHNKLGFTANAMLACRAEKSRATEIGKKLADVGIVSHCYERKTFKGWPYNIFAMLHGCDMRDIQKIVDRFVKKEKIKSFAILPTAAKFKK
jgi:DNA-binding Lrp family transcriptional regulator